MLQAYFDESGTHETSDIVLIAGFVADSSIWIEIENDWRKQLETSRVDYFHAVECENGKGIYQNLSRGIRDSLFNGVSGVIAKHKPMSVSAAVMRADWNQFKNGIIGETFGDPYNLCFEFCMQKISAWSRDEAQGEPVALIFAEQNEFKGRSDKIYELYRNNSRWGNELASLSFAAAAKCVALQSADLMAYETYKYAVGRQGNENTPLRPAMKKMVDANVRAIGGYYDAAAFAKLLRQTPVQL